MENKVKDEVKHLHYLHIEKTEKDSFDYREVRKILMGYGQNILDSIEKGVFYPCRYLVVVNKETYNNILKEVHLDEKPFGLVESEDTTENICEISLPYGYFIIVSTEMAGCRLYIK